MIKSELCGIKYSIDVPLVRARSKFLVFTKPEQQILKILNKSLTVRNPWIIDSDLKVLIDEAAADGRFDKPPRTTPWQAFCIHRKRLLAIGVLITNDAILRMKLEFDV